MIINPKEIKPSELHAYMLGAIAPRPIAFASTIDKQGHPNLSPFSFFNAFGSNPPLVIFSPALRGRDAVPKNTLENLREIDEVVINIVNFNMVQQMSLASTEYPKGVNEFIKSGFTPIPSDLIRPFRVKESPVQMECKVMEIIQTGVKGGAANLVICEILLMHINDDILNAEGKIDPLKIDQVARMGANWYSRAAKGLFEVPKPLMTLGVGVDQLPDAIKYSKILSGNDLGMLGNVERLPLEDELKEFAAQQDVSNLFKALDHDKAGCETAIHIAAKQLLAEKKVMEALKLLMLIIK